MIYDHKILPECSSVIIGVIDGPIDLKHPCFSGAQIATPYDDAPQPRLDCTATAHGTHVASIIFGQPNSSVVGFAPECRGVSLPVFGITRDNAIGCSQTDLARAILLALENSVDIINISGGQLDFSKEPEQFLKDALAQCESQGVLVVAAAGNDGCDCPHTPASCPTVLSVGAADDAGQPLSLSNWNASYRKNGLLAPGRDIAGAMPGGGIARRTGTSFAAPIVSAHAALLICEQIAQGGKRDPLAVRAALLASSRHYPSGQPGRARHVTGALDVAGASRLLKQGRENMTITDSYTDSSQFSAAIRPLSADAQETDAVGPIPDTAAVQLQATGRPSAAIVEAACGDGSCGCGGKAAQKGVCESCAKAVAAPASQIVYALGNLGYDFGTESRRDSMLQYFLKPNEGFTEKKLLAYLREEKSAGEAERLIWTLKIDGTPVYAIRPAGAFAYAGYVMLLNLFAAQLDGALPLIAVPGIAAGRTRLMSGESVPTLHPVVRGITPQDTAKVATKSLAAAEEAKRRRAENLYENTASWLRANSAILE